MLLQLENSHQDDINKLLAFAKTNNLKLTLIDDSETDYLLPGKPLTDDQLTQLINSSRNSDMISMKKAHEILSRGYGSD